MRNVNVIEEALFFDMRGNVLDYNNLPNDKIQVKGRLNGKDFELTTVTHNEKEIVTEIGIVYTYVPAQAKLIENAMSFEVDEYVFSDDNKTIYKRTKDIKEALYGIEHGLKVHARGWIDGEHYRITTRYVMTSSINSIIQTNQNCYIKTTNSVYKLV